MSRHKNNRSPVNCFCSTILLTAVLAVFLGQKSAFSATYYVDQTLLSDCPNYDVSLRTCGGGSDHAVADIDDALKAVQPGDTLYLRAGDYMQVFIRRSGTRELPIAISSYPGEAARIFGKSHVALWIVGHSDLIISDLIIFDVLGFGRLENATRVHLEGLEFRTADASGTTGALKFVRSSRNRVSSSSFDDGSDLLLLQDDSNLNVIEGNRFGRAGHSDISIRCSSQNVIRDNIFDNPSQKAMEMYDCEGTSDAPVRLDATSRNVLERNRFVGTKASGRPYDYNAIQHGAQNSIVRRNVFANNRGGGVNFQYYSEESLHVHGNRLYNNTFYNNRCYAIVGQVGSRKRYFDNRAKNNLLFRNLGCDGSARQTLIKNKRAVRLSSNFESSKDPGLVNPSGMDMRLRPTSTQIDKAEFVAKTASAGVGTSIPVDDASWFYDGFGIEGEVGDRIRLEGSGQSATIVKVDYENNILIVDADLSWARDEGVHLDFVGRAPDIGAFEFSRPKN